MDDPNIVQRFFVRELNFFLNPQNTPLETKIGNSATFHPSHPPDELFNPSNRQEAEDIPSVVTFGSSLQTSIAKEFGAILDASIIVDSIASCIQQNQVSLSE